METNNHMENFLNDYDNLEELDVDTTAISCGVRTITGVHNLDSLTKDEVGASLAYMFNKFMSQQWTDILFDYKIFVFSDVEGRGGNKLAKYIESNKLGTVVKSKCAPNPNTGNSIRVYVWTTNDKKLQKWYKKYSDKYNWEY